MSSWRSLKVKDVFGKVQHATHAVVKEIVYFSGKKERQVPCELEEVSVCAIAIDLFLQVGHFFIFSCTTGA